MAWAVRPRSRGERRTTAAAATRMARDNGCPWLTLEGSGTSGGGTRSSSSAGTRAGKDEESTRQGGRPRCEAPAGAAVASSRRGSSRRSAVHSEDEGGINPRNLHHARVVTSEFAKIRSKQGRVAKRSIRRSSPPSRYSAQTKGGKNHQQS